MTNVYFAISPPVPKPFMDANDFFPSCLCFWMILCKCCKMARVGLCGYKMLSIDFNVGLS